jgi:pantothenate kinase type III
MKNLIIAVDIGNSMTHIGLVDTTTLACIATTQFPSADVMRMLAEKTDSLISGTGNTVLPVTVCCVAGFEQQEINDAIRRTPAAGQIHHIGWHDRLPVHFIYDNPLLLGADRIANSLYAHAAYPVQGTVVIDAGTAVTVDFVSKNGKFLGGAILPGISTQFAALNRSTARLPDLGGTMQQAVFPATNTESCLNAGILIGLAGAIDSMVNRLEKQFGKIIAIACGGGWKQIGLYTEKTFIEKPHCTLIGTALYTPA